MATCISALPIKEDCNIQKARILLRAFFVVYPKSSPLEEMTFLYQLKESFL
jgi:hypothetical protein